MSRYSYCLDCDAPLPNVWPWTICNEDGLCAECDDARWLFDEDDEQETNENIDVVD
jgi:hypothetical protein